MTDEERKQREERGERTYPNVQRHGGTSAREGSSL